MISNSGILLAVVQYIPHVKCTVLLLSPTNVTLFRMQPDRQKG